MEEKPSSFRSSASFGKRQEYRAVAELLCRGFDVYMTLVDDRQIDCIIRKEVGDKLVYIDIQIKARSQEANPNNAGRFPQIKLENPRPNFFYIFYSEPLDCYWIVPSLELVEMANRRKSGQNVGKYNIVFTNVSKKTGTVKPRPKFEKYRNNFALLTEFKD